MMNVHMCLTKFMGKKGGTKKLPRPESGNHPISLREEATGKIKTKPASNVKSNLRIDHLKKLAVWATTDPHIPSLGAFYGQHLATLAEATGVPPDPSLFTCQRCETVLHPGFNATIRIEKNRSKVRHKHKKSGNIAQNNVVYKCHFCSHQNLKRGTPKRHMKRICPSIDKPSSESTPAKRNITLESSKLEKGSLGKSEANEIPTFESSKLKKGSLGRDETNAIPTFDSQVVVKDVPLLDEVVTPALFEGKKRRRNSSISKKAIETPSVSARVEVTKTHSTSTNKRRRKSWTSLKEIAKNKEHDNSQVANLAIPFFL